MYISFELGAENSERLLNLARMLCDAAADFGGPRHQVVQMGVDMAREPDKHAVTIVYNNTLSPDRKLTDQAAAGPSDRPEVVTAPPAALDPADNPETGAPAPQPPTPPAPVSEAAAAFGAVPLVPPAPPVVAPAPAPSATPASGPSATGSPALDADGLPWDARIHAGGQAKNADGRWRARRNTAPEVVARVTAELRAAMGAPPAVVTPPLPPVPPAPPVPGAPPLPPAAAPALTPWQDLCLLVSRGKTDGWLSDAQLTAACQTVGLAALPMLANRVDLIPAVRAVVEGYRPRAQ